MIVVYFFCIDDVFKFVVNLDVFEFFVLKEGDCVGLFFMGEIVIVEEVMEEGMFKFVDGCEFDEEDVWFVDLSVQLIDCFVKGKVDCFDVFLLCFDLLYFEKLCIVDKFVLFFGGWICFFFYQFYVVECVIEELLVCWLFVDEVGFGKMVELCLIFNYLI